MLEMAGMTTEDLRSRADQLREVLRGLDDGQVQVSGRERAFIAGALRAVELMHVNSGEIPSDDSVSCDPSGR